MSCGILVLLTAMNQSFLNKIKSDRYFDHLRTDYKNKTLYQKLFVRSDHWRYGDLYGLSYLPQYRFKLSPYKEYHLKASKKCTNRILYIIGDSFLADKNLKNAFYGFDDVIFIDRRFPFKDITLEKARENYLILEFAERNLTNFEHDDTGKIIWTRNDTKTLSLIRNRRC
jgi:hypothetical protein